MNDVVAANIRLCREHRGWTQEHLAGAAGLAARTVQRAERGQGMSAETLTAIAGALDVTIDDLRVDLLATMAAQFGVPREELTPELAQQRLEEQQKELAAKYVMVGVQRITGPGAFRALEGAHALAVESISISEEAEDVTAELRQYLQDYVDVARDLGAVEFREVTKAAFEIVQRLEALGCGVCVGLQERRVRFASGEPMMWSIGYVVVTKASDVREFIAIERNARMRMQ